MTTEKQGNNKGFLGFNCKTCGKPFFIMHNTPQCIKDDKSEIAKYEKLGYEFTKIPDDLVADIDNWCHGHRKGDK